MSERVLNFLADAEAYGERARARVRTVVRDYRETFLVTVCAGLAAYGFAMLNVLNNQDNISNTPGGYGAGISSGRWFLEWLAETLRTLWGTNTLPLFNGLLSIVLVALAACLTASVLELRARPFRALTGALFVTFPSLAMTMLFMFTVGYYSFALLLAVVGVYWAKNVRGLYGILPASVCMTLSLGIYQAYLPVAAALFLLILLRYGCAERPPSALRLCLEGVRFLSVLVLGALFYMVVLRLSLSHSGQVLNEYQQIDQMGSISVSELPDMIAATYQNFFNLPFHAKYAVNDTPVIRFGFLCSLLLSAVLFLWLEVRGRAERGVKLLNALYFTLFPAGAFSIVIMCYHSSIFGRMVYGAVTAFFLPFVLLECVRERGGVAVRVLRKGAAAALSVLLLLTSANYVWQSNENYMVLYYTNRQTENYFASMATRIRTLPGYRQDLYLAFVGENITDRTFTNSVYRGSAHRYGGYTEASNYRKAGLSYMTHYLGFHQPTASAEDVLTLADMETVRAMPCYPDDGSIRIIDGYIVVKLED
ncbi:MAG: glucosyltransferase domain-containing protein [Oscillibacter sp.]|nr:glucosyltransferase domain-containing protein [Oscillibacter sp.]